MKFNIEKLILEGPDLSGKSSLYDEIHKRTKFKWNIQDRSSLSMVCYAIQYKRNTEFHRQMLYKELSNLNNRMIILMPNLEVLIARYLQRGDDFQNIDSLKSLYYIFKEEVKKIQNLPNVFVFTEDLSKDELAKSSILWSNLSENVTPKFIGDDFVRKFVTFFGKDDDHRISLESSGVIKKDYDNSILENDLEGEYYRQIESDFTTIIENEFNGINEYGVPQTLESRRFYYSSSTCISSLHFKVKDRKLYFLCTLRSTDVVKNAGIDFQFLVYLVHRMANLYFTNCEEYQLCLNMNSAHIRRDL